MTLEQYQILTGTTVSAANTAIVTAQLARTQAILETMLGFTLTPAERNTNLYTELGKTTNECGCSNIDEDNLLPADSVTYAYRMYDYNEKDRYLFVDPMTAVHKVKLVKDGVTVKTFTTDEYTVNFDQNGLAKFIDVNCKECLCVCICKQCVQLAVDATWAFETIPDDLLYVWADMVTYYADCKTDVKSETLGTHSYTKFDRREAEFLPHNLAVIKKYAGPYGSVTKVVTV